MEKGKELCKALKEIRRQIADANGIEYIITECSHKGDCAGTCAKCDSEVRYLENQLNLRKKAGKTIKIIGIAAGLSCISAGLAACDDNTEGDICVDTTEIKWKSGNQNVLGTTHVAANGGSILLQCTNDYPSVLNVSVNTNGRQANYKLCELDKNGKPTRIVKSSKEGTVVPVLSENDIMDEDDVLCDWLTITYNQDKTVEITFDKNDGAERIVIIDFKGIYYGNLVFQQEGNEKEI